MNLYQNLKYQKNADCARTEMPLLFSRAVIIIFFAAALLISSGASAQSRNALDSLESESLGLIIKYIEMVEEKPLLAAIFSIKTGRTVEYTLGDYIEGKLIRDILEDRVVLYDEITRHQFVLIFNDVVSAAEEEQNRETSLIRIKEKKRDIEEMNVTNIFNNELNKAQGKEPLKFGAPDSQQEEDAKQQMNRYTRDFKDNQEGFKNTPETAPSSAPADGTKEAGLKEKGAGTVEVEVREKGGGSGTKSVEIAPAKGAPAGAATSETTLKRPQANQAAQGAATTKTPDGTQVKIRQTPKKDAGDNILEDR
jgi:hypothetical protein